MNREYTAFACAVACAVAIPFVVNALAAKLSEMPTEERWIRALLYCCVNVALLVTIFRLWLLG